MNLIPSYGTYWFLGSLLVSWAMSTFIEGLIWHQILKRQIKSIRAVPIVGYMSVVQVISTPLSFGIAILLFGFFINPITVPSYTMFLHLGISLAYNPWGVFIGFFIAPILLEFWFWRSGVKRALQSQDLRTIEFGALTRWQYIGASTVIANSSTFLLGMVTNFSVYIGALFLIFSSFVTLFMIGIFLWFVSTIFQQRGWRNQPPQQNRMQFLAGDEIL